MLGVSEFPISCCPEKDHETPLQLFDADERAQINSSRPQASTPRGSSAAELHFNTPGSYAPPSPPTLSPHKLSIEDVKRIVQETLQDNLRHAADKQIQENQQLAQRVHECKAQLITHKNELADSNRHINDLEGQIQQQQREITELRAAIAQQDSKTVLKVRPDLSDVSLTQLDVESTHEYDSIVPKQTLSPDRINRIRNFSKTKRIFVANVARQMYSMEERVRDCNVSGGKSRPSISPAKSRFQTICYYTSEQYGCPMDANLQRDVTKTIDDTNRRFRDDLKIRKYKRNSVEGTIVQINNDDE